MIYTIYVENDVINLTRGDDGELEIPLETDEGDEFELSEDEYLIFGVRELPIADSPVLLEIESEPGSNIIRFRHADTANLAVGFYSAEVQMMTSDGQRQTVWPTLTGAKRTSTANRRNFCLMTEVVFR